MTEIIYNIVATLIINAAIWIAIGARWFYRRHFSNQITKFTYFRVLRLRSIDRDKPYYTRHHSTISDNVDVFDETLIFNGTQCRHPLKLEPMTISGSRFVEAFQVIPKLAPDADPHPHSKNDSGKFTFKNDVASTQLAAIGTLINGIQTKEHWWYGTTAQYDGQTLILIVDFSALPFDECPAIHVHPVLEQGGKAISREGIESRWLEDHLHDSIHYLRYSNAKKGDCIKWVFTIDWDRVPKYSRKNPPKSPS